MIGVADFENSNINQLGTIEGTQSPGRSEIIFSENLMNSTGFQVGDEIEIELPDGSTHYLTVVGLVSDQQSARPTSSGIVNAFVTLDTVRALGLGSYFNRILITVEGDGSDEAFIAKVAADVEDKIESHNRGVYQTEENKSNEHPMIDTILAMLGVLGALGVLITILSASLIVNTLNALLTQQLRQIGVMKLIGARSLTNSRHVFRLDRILQCDRTDHRHTPGSHGRIWTGQFCEQFDGRSFAGFPDCPSCYCGASRDCFSDPTGRWFFPGQ